MPIVRLPYPPSSQWRSPTYADTTMCSNIPQTGTYTSLAGNANYACALSINRSIVCWGAPWFTSWASIVSNNQSSSVLLFGNVWRADNLTSSVFDTPYQVTSAPAVYAYTQMCAASMFTCGLTTMGVLFAGTEYMKMEVEWSVGQCKLFNRHTP